MLPLFVTKMVNISNKYQADSKGEFCNTFVYRPIKRENPLSANIKFHNNVKTFVTQQNKTNIFALCLAKI
jgi:hypothetical protein